MGNLGLGIKESSSNPTGDIKVVAVQWHPSPGLHKKSRSQNIPTPVVYLYQGGMYTLLLVLRIF